MACFHLRIKIVDCNYKQCQFCAPFCRVPELGLLYEHDVGDLIRLAITTGDALTEAE